MIHSGLVRYHDDLAGLMVDIDTVSQHPENANNGDVEEIMVSIEVDGMYRPIEVQRSTGFILAGNHTWEACKGLEATTIPVVYLDVDDNNARRILGKDNWIARNARPDYAAEVALLDRIKEDSPDGLVGLGKNDQDLEVLRHLAEMVTEFEHASWPTFSIQLHPRMMKAFKHITREAATDRDKFELLLRLAGWDGQ